MAIKCKGSLSGRKQAGTLVIGIGSPTFSTPDSPLCQVELTGKVAQLLSVEGDQRHRWLVLDDVPPEGTPARAAYHGSRPAELDFANISGPGAASVDTHVQDAGQAFTLARPSKLPLTVQIRSENGLITAVYIGGAWHNVWTISDTSSLVLGIVFGLIGVLLLAWPWLRWITRPSTHGSMAW